MNTNGRTSSGRVVWVLAGALFAWVAIGAAGARAEYDLRPSPEQTALARETCANVMRIRQGFVPFYACVESLSGVLSEKSWSHMVSKGTSAGHGIVKPEETSYSESNPQERRRKEEYSCAQLGISPGSAGFGQCVAQLDIALRNVEHSD